QQPAFPDLGFPPESLAPWEGTGFAVSGKEGQGYSVSSQDPAAGAGHKAMLHRAFLVPAGAGIIRCSAFAARNPDCTSDDRLDVVLMAAGKRILPKRVRTATGWQPASRLLPAQNGQPHEYLWQIADYTGQYLRIVLVDEDDRPGCYLWCSSFQI